MEENGSFLSRGGVAGYRPPQIAPISYVWTHILYHAEKYDIKTAGSRLVAFEKQGYGQGTGGKRSRWARFVAWLFRMPRFHSSSATFQVAFEEECP